MKVITLELYKLRHKRLFLMATLFVLVEILWAALSTSMSMNRNPDYARWEQILLTVSTMNSLFLPILTAICVSRICDMEHKGNTWKLLLTLSVKKRQLYFAKYVSASFIMVWIVGLQILSMIAFGKMKSFVDPVPFDLFIQYFVGTMITTFALIALQQWISISVKNQAFPLTLGMIGSFIGLMGGLFPEGIRKFLIWTYYMNVSPIQQKFIDHEVKVTVLDFKTILPWLVFLLIVGSIMYIAGNVHTARQEV